MFAAAGLSVARPAGRGKLEMKEKPSMADFLGRATGKSDPWVEAKIAAEFIQAEFPYLYQVFIGSPPNAAGISRHPGSVRIFTNGNEMKAMLSGKEWENDGYLVIPKQVNLLEGIETALEAGLIGWSKSREHLNSSKKPTY
jgi:hypothetical protein